ncbi:MAG: LysR family transcriptional regulator [Schwartzia sp.]|nr:LysR family transcriptional regulator [Schwartzia sp. (in: firmicutes)]
MELRVLNYFLAVARTENISRAAEELNISQPALSRQLMDLEEELGVRLLARGKRRTTLTEEGYLLKQRAEEIAELVDKTVDELAHAQADVSGSIRIGCAETAGMKVIAEAIQALRQDYPKIRAHLYSLDDSGVRERLSKGTLDFGVLVEPAPPSNYPYIEIGHEDRWGVFMKKDSPLADLTEIHPEDLEGLPLILSQQALANRELKNWFGKDERDLDIVASYTLIYNASLMAGAGVGYLLSLDRILNLTPDSGLVFRPLSPPCTCRIFFIWKPRQIFSKAAALLKERLARG